MRVTVVTAAVDLGRKVFRSAPHDFEAHYGQACQLMARGNVGVVAFVSWGGGVDGNLLKRHFNTTDIEKWSRFDSVRERCGDSSWRERCLGPRTLDAPELALPHYLPLTLIKMDLLKEVSEQNPFDSEVFFWLDSSSACETIDPLHLSRLEWFPRGRFAVSIGRHGYEYDELHGTSRETMSVLAGRCLDSRYVVGMMFGGSRSSIRLVHREFGMCLGEMMNLRDIGTEESVLTALVHRTPELFSQHEHPLMWYVISNGRAVGVV